MFREFLNRRNEQRVPATSKARILSEVNTKGRPMRLSNKKIEYHCALNIAEGNGRWHARDWRNFFWIARGSAFECVPLVETLSAKEIDDGGDLSGIESRTRDHFQNVDRINKGDGVKFAVQLKGDWNNGSMDRILAVTFPSIAPHLHCSNAQILAQQKFAVDRTGIVDCSNLQYPML
jgi:hypothetical protein